MPNLANLLSKNADDTVNFNVPDVYIRDYIGDNGSVPTNGIVCRSPDIILRNVAVMHPNALFGQNSGNENSEILSQKVKTGQDNYIYIRNLNKGNQNSVNTTTDVYWSEVSTLTTPNQWNYIGTTNSMMVSTGNVLTCSHAIVWNSTDIPGPGHYCFIAITGSNNDPKTLTTNQVANFANTGMSFNDYLTLIMNNNNVAWKNFNVIDIVPTIPDKIKFPPLNFNGAFDKDTNFNLRIKSDLKKVKIIIPNDIELNLVELLKSASIDFELVNNEIKIPIDDNLIIKNLNLLKNKSYKCKFEINDDKLSSINKKLQIIQEYEGLNDKTISVGDVTCLYLEDRYNDEKLNELNNFERIKMPIYKKSKIIQPVYKSFN